MNSRKLFNLLKLSAEAFIEQSLLDYQIVRPSNVFGCVLKSPLFLPSIVRDVTLKKQVTMFVNPEYAKDYNHIDDAVKLILQITCYGQQKVYNIASGKNISAQTIAAILQQETNCQIVWKK
ncbi:NAD-dependent epimerase/dehydratase family protein [Aliikangiella maris]|uniref:NAD-dependent epimerase/dehydratase family protein n=1 Tax=Aliikangiella maris TaxID=3162458 RepID=A0ABV3MLG3_9GAMM